MGDGSGKVRGWRAGEDGSGWEERTADGGGGRGREDGLLVE